MNELTIRRPDDWHAHLRQDGLLDVVEYTARHFGRALVMPNTVPPILTAEDAARYRDQISYRWLGGGFQPVMTIKITDATTPEMILAAKEAGVIAGKAYPVGVTTGSTDGITDFETKNLNNVFQTMAEVGMVLCIHGEEPEWHALHAEQGFIMKFGRLAREFPELKIVLEHASTKHTVGAVNMVLNVNVAATITAHHLLLTFGDVVDAKMHPHNFCKPIAKTPEDKDALIKAATSGNPKFFFGSDSAPHLRTAKENASVPAGCFTAPVALPLLAQIFEDAGALDKLEDFTSRFGAEFYGLPLNEGTVTLVKKPWVVPTLLNGCVPFMAGQELIWRVA